MSDDKPINQLKDLGKTKVTLKGSENGTLVPEPTNSEDLDKPLHDAKGNLTLEGLKVLMASTNSPAEHFTVDIGINAFKKYLKTIPGITKSMINDQVRRYKSKAWGEYTELVKHKGSFPTHNTQYCVA